MTTSDQIQPVSGDARFLITRLSAFGDCVLTLPLLCALRAQFPASKIAWLVQPEWAPLLESHPDLDEVILFERRWRAAPGALFRLSRRLKARQFDVVIDPQSLTKSSLPGWVSGARMRIGLAPPVGRELAPWLNNILVEPQGHVIDRYLGLLRPLGVHQPEIRFNLPVHAEPLISIQRFLMEQRGLRRFAIINPGAGWLSKRWPLDRFATVARYLDVVYGIRSVVAWHGEPEWRMAHEIAAEAGGAALPAPPTSLRELAALCRAAELFIGSDSGPLHLAAAVGTPCIGLFGATRKEEVGPVGNRHISLQESYQAGSCRFRRRCSNVAMQAITVSHVFDACDRLLDREIPVGLPTRDIEHAAPRLPVSSPRPAAPMSTAIR